MFHDPHFNEAGLQAFRRIQGDFRPSRIDRAIQTGGALVLMAIGALVVGRMYRDYRAHGAVPSMWILLIEGVGMVALGLYLFQRAGCWSRFNLGQLQYLTASGKVLWEEELAGVVALQKCYSRGGEYLVVRWDKRKHRLPLPEVLEAALETAMTSGRVPPREVPGEVDVAAELPTWRCAKCGEENPGNFAICWKCEAANPAIPQVQGDASAAGRNAGSSQVGSAGDIEPLAHLKPGDA